jgi:hypothetical protein
MNNVGSGRIACLVDSGESLKPRGERFMLSTIELIEDVILV